jgi:hypothetical protein
MVIIPIHSWGKEQPIEKKPIACNTCTPIGGTYVSEDVECDSEMDAQYRWDSEAKTIVNDGLEKLWKTLWDKFSCDRNGECEKKEACGNRPTHVEAGIIDKTVPDPDSGTGTRVVWTFYVSAQREIKCVAGEPEGEEDVPFLPYPTLEVRMTERIPIRASVYYKWGKKALETTNQAPVCDSCTAIGATWTQGTKAKDAEIDAETALENDCLALVNEGAEKVWTALWNLFKCPKDLECQRKTACGDAPTYIEAGVREIEVAESIAVVTGKKIVWAVYVAIEREIKCISGDPATAADVPFTKYKSLPGEEI